MCFVYSLDNNIFTLPRYFVVISVPQCKHYQSQKKCSTFEDPNIFHPHPEKQDVRLDIEVIKIDGEEVPSYVVYTDNLASNTILNSEDVCIGYRGDEVNSFEEPLITTFGEVSISGSGRT